MDKKTNKVLGIGALAAIAGWAFYSAATADPKEFFGGWAKAPTENKQEISVTGTKENHTPMLANLFSTLASKILSEAPKSELSKYRLRQFNNCLEKQSGKCSMKIGLGYEHVAGPLWKPHPFEKEEHTAKLYYHVENPNGSSRFLKIY